MTSPKWKVGDTFFVWHTIGTEFGAGTRVTVKEVRSKPAGDHRYYVRNADGFETWLFEDDLQRDDPLSGDARGDEATGDPLNSARLRWAKQEGKDWLCYSCGGTGRGETPAECSKCLSERGPGNGPHSVKENIMGKKVDGIEETSSAEACVLEAKTLKAAKKCVTESDFGGAEDDREAADEFLEAMRDDPELVAERVAKEAKEEGTGR